MLLTHLLPYFNKGARLATMCLLFMINREQQTDTRVFCFTHIYHYSFLTLQESSRFLLPAGASYNPCMSSGCR